MILKIFSQRIQEKLTKLVKDNQALKEEKESMTRELAWRQSAFINSCQPPEKKLDERASSTDPDNSTDIKLQEALYETKSKLEDKANPQGQSVVPLREKGMSISAMSFDTATNSSVATQPSTLGTIPSSSSVVTTVPAVFMHVPHSASSSAAATSFLTVAANNIDSTTVGLATTTTNTTVSDVSHSTQATIVTSTPKTASVQNATCQKWVSLPPLKKTSTSPFLSTVPASKNKVSELSFSKRGPAGEFPLKKKSTSPGQFLKKKVTQESSFIKFGLSLASPLKSKPQKDLFNVEKREKKCTQVAQSESKTVIEEKLSLGKVGHEVTSPYKNKVLQKGHLEKLRPTRKIESKEMSPFKNKVPKGEPLNNKKMADKGFNPGASGDSEPFDMNDLFEGTSENGSFNQHYGFNSTDFSLTRGGNVTKDEDAGNNPFFFPFDASCPDNGPTDHPEEKEEKDDFFSCF